MGEIKAILKEIKEKKLEIKNLVAENKLEEAKEAKKELQRLQDKFEILQDIMDDENQDILDSINDGEVNDLSNISDKNKETIDLKTQVKAFVNVMVSKITKQPANEKDIEIVNMMNEGDPDSDGISKGGLTVPQDIQTQIKEKRRTLDDLEQYVNIETTTVKEGSRVIEVNADETPWDDVEEAGQFPDAPDPEFKNVKYKVTKKGGILKITNELLKDSAENIMAYLVKHMSKKSRVTRNAFILKKIREITKGKEVPITDFDDLKDIFNEKLDPSIAATSIIITNQKGFNYLDKLKDKDGNYIMQKDITDKTKKLLFGEYLVIKVSDKTLKPVEIKGIDEQADTIIGYKYPVICGDLKEAITLFDREKLSIELNDKGDKYWDFDLTGVKMRDRFDVKAMDEEAVIMGEIEVTI